MTTRSSETASIQYAVLHHTGADQPHYDLLFESSPGSLLITFRLAEWPITKPQPAIKLRDHRRLYLTYEGLIPGGDKGRVDRLAEGSLLLSPAPAGYLLHHPDGTPFLQITPDELDPTSQQWWISIQGSTP